MVPCIFLIGISQATVPKTHYYLIADDIWFGENMDSKYYSQKDKGRIMNYVKQLQI
jgi:hypothetical protein